MLPENSTPATSAIGGMLLGVAGLTRTIGVLLLVPAAGYLLLRRTGWRCLLSFLVAGSSLLTAYAGWTYAKTGAFGLTRADGLFLWARTMTFADCDTVRPEPKLAVLCPRTPVSGRPAPAFWLWSSWSPLHALPRGVDKNLLAGRKSVLFTTRSGRPRSPIRAAPRRRGSSSLSRGGCAPTSDSDIYRFRCSCCCSEARLARLW
ncbi:hypothetical protein ACQP25_41610 [Microtetraspora malaysiensis]|uniref:hypothetical protein n=1 Tax=Microtetraspora malaysiensis TaxID=161358 RepID=UPI003D9103ED